MSNQYIIPSLPLDYELETKPILKQLARSHQKLAELKGLARSIPNENILINTLILQEARDSSSVENIITTQDDVFKADLAISESSIPAAVKEVSNYREALMEGFTAVKEKGLLTNNTITRVQNILKKTNTGFRQAPGTNLKRDDGVVVYEPPQNIDDIISYMTNLEKFINDTAISDLDPLIKMAVIHHQFESIHPYPDGNGRTGRILNVLYLVMSGLLDYPILYLSRYITHNKSEYYHLIQAIRDASGNSSAEWQAWVLFILVGIEEISIETISLIEEMKKLMAEYKAILRPAFGSKYKHELINNLFFHPYTKIEFMQSDANVSRDTAAKYLENIVELGLLDKRKLGRENYYINTKLMDLFLNRDWIDAK